MKQRPDKLDFFSTKKYKTTSYTTTLNELSEAKY